MSKETRQVGRPKQGAGKATHLHQRISVELKNQIKNGAEHVGEKPTQFVEKAVKRRLEDIGIKP